MFRLLNILYRHEKGISLIETIIAVSILSAIAVAFLNGVATSSQGVYISDEEATAESLARTQMEWVKKASYSYNATSYSAAFIPTNKDYINYSANITAEQLHEPDDGIQKITVTIMRFGEKAFILEGFKVDR